MNWWDYYGSPTLDIILWWIGEIGIDLQHLISYWVEITVLYISNIRYPNILLWWDCYRSPTLNIILWWNYHVTNLQHLLSYWVEITVLYISNIRYPNILLWWDCYRSPTLDIILWWNYYYNRSPISDILNIGLRLLCYRTPTLDILILDILLLWWDCYRSPTSYNRLCWDCHVIEIKHQLLCWVVNLQHLKSYLAEIVIYLQHQISNFSKWKRPSAYLIYNIGCSIVLRWLCHRSSTLNKCIVKHVNHMTMTTSGHIMTWSDCLKTKGNVKIKLWDLCETLIVYILLSTF